MLATFDYVVASVHSHFQQSREEMTARIIRAISHPHVTMLGHATGRLLLRRDGYQVDLEAVLQAAAKHGTMIEINAHPQRLDLDWIHCKRAKALGVKLVINPDAHSTDDVAPVRLRRRRGPPRLAGEEGRVQHADAGAGDEGAGGAEEGGFVTAWRRSRERRLLRSAACAARMLRGSDGQQSDCIAPSAFSLGNS